MFDFRRIPICVALCAVALAVWTSIAACAVPVLTFGCCQTIDASNRQHFREAPGSGIS